MHQFSLVKSFRPLLAAAVTVAAFGAQAAVVTFSGLTPDQINLANYVEAGMTVKATNSNVYWGYPTGQQLHLDPASFENSDYDFTFSGGLFDLVSVDVSYASDGAVGTWTAFDASNNQIASFAMSGATATTINTFAGFTGISRLHLINTVSHFSIDNLTFRPSDTAVAAVPEPETYALMLAGLAAIATTVRRRKSA